MLFFNFFLIKTTYKCYLCTYVCFSLLVKYCGGNNKQQKPGDMKEECRVLKEKISIQQPVMSTLDDNKQTKIRK